MDTDDRDDNQYDMGKSRMGLYSDTIVGSRGRGRGSSRDRGHGNDRGRGYR
jgi:hypothetical protein